MAVHETTRSGRLFLALVLLAGGAGVVLTAPEPAAGKGGEGREREAAEAARRIDAALGVSASDDSRPAEDHEFLRRVYLDLLGRPPSRTETVAFLEDGSERRRERLLGRLLDSGEWAELTARRWEAVLFPDPDRIRVNAAGKRLAPAAGRRARERFGTWLRERLDQDAPWSRVVRDLVASRGSLAKTPELLYKAAFFSGGRADLNIADGMSRDLLGIRISCARCHDHPFDRWTREDYYQLAAYATRVRAVPPEGAADRLVKDILLTEADSGELSMPGSKKVMSPRFLTGGERPGLDDDRMGQLAAILSGTEAGRLQTAKNVVNREWAYLLGRGFVEPVDDFHRRNPAAAERAFDRLVSEFREHGESLRFLHRTILLTDAYQRSSAGGSDEPFSSQGVRQLTPMQLFRSLVTAVEGWDGPPDFAGARLRRLYGTFRKRMGPLYGAGSTWTDTTPLPGNARQALFVRNGRALDSLLGSPAGLVARIYRLGSTADRLDAVFLAVLGRRPESFEAARFTMHVEETQGFQTAWEDVIWTLVNSAEFLTRH